MTVITNSVAVSGTSQTTVLAEEETRNVVYITNDEGNGEIYLAVGTSALRGRGIPLMSKGSVFSMSKTDLASNAITAVGTTDGLRLAVHSW